MRYLTLVFVAFFATSCTGETNSMRGYFYDMAEPPMMMMDGDGGSGGGGSDDDEPGQSRGERALSESFGAASRGEIGIQADRGTGFGRGTPDVGQSRGEQSLSETFGDRSRGPVTQPGGADMRRIQGNESNTLGATRPRAAQAPAEATPEVEKAQKVKEEIRRAVVTLGIPGTLARANTLF